MSANPVHDWEQFTAAARDCAGAVAAYFKGLVAGGFARSEALTLTLAWQNSMMSNLLKKDDGYPKV